MRHGSAKQAALTVIDITVVLAVVLPGNLLQGFKSN
jgi:hypothetical protein